MLLNSSSRNYNLRTRARSGTITQPRRGNDDSPDVGSLSSEAPPRYEGTASSTEATGNVRLYSDAVALRPPSPRRERPLLPSTNPTTSADRAKEPEPSDEEDHGSRGDDTRKVEENESGEDVETPDKPEYAGWTKVQHRRTRSDSFLNKRKALTSGQKKVVDLATENLTKEQRQKLRQRQEKIRPRRDSDSSTPSRGEGTSKRKGKTIDPREWGNVNLSRDSLDVDAQAAAWNSLKSQHGASGPSQRTHHKRSHRQPQEKERARQRKHRSSKAPRTSERPAETQPAAQIAPKSYLGSALRNVGHQKRSRRTPGSPSSPSSSSSDSPSDSSDSSSTSSRDDSSESSSEESDDDRRGHGRGKKRRSNRHGRNKRRRRSSSSSTKTSIKPIPPKEYDGSADVRAYHRFVRESDAYLRDGKVKSRRKVFLLSYYLTDKAYDFYTQKVAINEEQWTVPEFYTELFNFCFPVDYRMQLRKTLARCHQNDKSVAEYAYELLDLFNMIGNVSEQDQVLKFWNSSRPSIQRELWKNKLNPELSSWEDVVTQAEIIEIAENVADRRDRRPGQSSQIAGAASGSGMNNPKGKSRATDTGGSARAVTFGSQHRSRDKRHRKRPHDTRDGQSRGGTPYSREGTPAGPWKGKFKNVSVPPSGPSSNNKKFVRKGPQLSEKEIAEYRAAGRCFNCGKEGHMSRNCPDSNTVKSQGRGPPGASSFNLEPVHLSETDSDDQPEILDSLPLGAMFFGDPDRLTSVQPWPIDEWESHYPYWDEPYVLARERIGDCYAMVIDTILTLEAPYPGDARYDYPELRPELRFHVKRQSVTRDYVIRDRLTDSRCVLSRDLLEDPEFNVSGWYARQRAEALGRTEETIHYCCIGDAISIVAVKLLSDGISSSYPCTNPRLDPSRRFYLWPPRTEDGITNYTIYDADLDTTTDVQRIWLEDPSFDLVSWYRRHLSQQGLFEYNYYDTHRELYRESSVSREDAPGRQPDEFPDRPDLSGLGQKNSDDRSTSAAVMEADEEWDDLPDLEPLEPDDDLFEEDSCENLADFDDIPDLQAMSDSEDEEEDPLQNWPYEDGRDDTRIAERVRTVLERCQPYPGDAGRISVDPRYTVGDPRFVIEWQDRGLFCIYDRFQGFEAHIHVSRLRWDAFSIGKWFAERAAENSELDEDWDRAYERAHRWTGSRAWEDTLMGPHPVRGPSDWITDSEPIEDPVEESLELGGIQVDRHQYPTLQRNAAQVKGNQRVLPKPLVVKVTVNGHPARALLDSGSLGDFMSSTLADQLGIQKEPLSTPLALQLAVQGSRSKVNYVAIAQLQYQDIDEKRTFDVINLSSYDLILGMPWMHQHQVCIGFNPARVVIGSDESRPLKVGSDTKLMVHTLTPEERSVENAREELRQYAEPLCKEMVDTDLPPLRDINHTIPLIDVDKTYAWRPSRCPEVFREQWAEKRDAYIKTGRWIITSARNTVPMLLIPKPGTKPPLLRTVVDLRERNSNTRKLTSPLPDMEGMLRRAAGKPFRTALDLKNAYEQIRIVPEHVERSAVTTPDGNMVSQVIQQGDCNAPATYQTLMNHLFSAYIGRFMDIYLDDIVIYSDTMEEHVKHVKLVMDILQKEKLYLSRSKLRFIAPELKLLGRVVDNEGICMDAEKVDSVLNWKVPTNRDLLRGFIGSVGYLADDIPNIRLPMGVLSAITGDTVPFRWGYTEQRAFDEVKALVHQVREHRRVPLNYAKDAPPIWMVTDGCSTGISGLVSQGEDWKEAKIAAFYSAKLNPAQQNYPTHEIEMFAGVETMLRHIDILQGVKFKWLTDHKGLTYLLNQKNLSGRQARWLEKISSFTFEVVYIAGSENVVADALSRIYSNDSSGTVRARSEYTYHDVIDDNTVEVQVIPDFPVLAGIEARIATRRGSRVRRPSQKKADMAAPDTTADSSTSTAARESAKDFAARVKSRFVLRGPQAPHVSTEGGSTINEPPISTIHEENEPQSNVHEEDSTTLTEEPAEPPEAMPVAAKETSNTLLSIVSQSLQGLDLLAELRGKFELDPAFQPIIAKPKDFRNFEVDGQLVYLRAQGKRVLCIPKIAIQGRSAHEIVISEAHSLLAHLGASKTLDYLRDHCWWKSMVTDVQAFCETCRTCRTSKPSNQKPYGLLNPLSVPSYPWESIGMDFVGPLPESGNRDGLFDSITVVICLLTSMVHLVPSRTNYNASQLAELVFEHVYKLHGLPLNIISDRDVLFTSTFWKQLHRLIGTKLRLSSAYHPQSDGSTERANRTITQMLRQCVHPNQKDWVTKLPAIEFAINSARSESTGFAPFFLNSGRMPRAMLWTSNLTSEFPSVREFALQRKLAIMAAHDSILSARVKQTRDANRKRRPTPFKEGELVYLSTKNIKFAKGLASKLIPKFIGPYKILQDFGNSSFRLELPGHLKQRGVHDVFHSSLLREHIPNDDRLFPGRLDTQIGDTIETEGKWAVDRILSHSGSKADAVFEIQWKSGDITWLPYYQITHLRALTEYLDLLGKKNIKELAKGTGKPPLEDPQVFLGALSLDTPPISNPSYPVSHYYKDFVEVSAPDHDFPANHSAFQHSFCHTLVEHTPLATTWPHLVAQNCEGLTTRTSSTYHPLSIDYAIQTTLSALPSTSPRSPSTSDSTRKYVSSRTSVPSTPIPWATSSSADSGTAEPLLATHDDSVTFTWLTTPRTMRPNHLTTPHSLPTSISPQPKPDSPLTTLVDPLMPPRITSSTSTPLSWLQGRKSNEKALRNAVSKESEPSIRENSPHLEYSTIPPTSVVPESVPGNPCQAVKRLQSPLTTISL